MRPRGIYATTKADSEQAARHVHPETVIARAFHHTGPGQTPQFALAQWARDLERSVSPVRTGDLSLRRDYSDVRDIARGYIHLLDHGPPGAIVNLCSGRAPSLEQLLQTMAGSGGVVTQPVREWFRVDDPPELRGDPSTAIRLGWRSTTPIAVTLQDLRASFRPG